MDLSLTEEEREIRDWVRTFVTREIMPLESTVLERERRNESALEPGQLEALQAKARDAGFWGCPRPRSTAGWTLPR